MRLPFPDTESTESDPLTLLESVGHVFATFDERTQDSGNVSYSVEVDGRRYFVKTAGLPEASQPYFDQSRVHAIDLDSYHMGTFTNRMGRMFGSTRFMAPEEFELGATIDERTTVFTMGRTAAVLMSDGSLDREPFLGTDRQLDVMLRACEEDPNDRFQSVAELYAAWMDAKRQLIQKE